MNRRLLLKLLLISFFSMILTPVYGEKIKKKKPLTIAIKDNLRPLGYRDQDGNLQGLEIDLAYRLASELFGDDTPINLIPVSNQERLQVVVDRQVDFAIASVTANASRRRIVDFTDPYYFDSTGIIVKKSLNKPSVSNFQGKLGVIANSRSLEQISYNLPQVTLHIVASYENALQLMETGEIDGFAGDVTVLTGWVQEKPEYELLSPRIGAYPLSIVLPKGRQYQELRDRVNQVIRKLNQEGWLKEKALFWGLPVN